MGRVSVFVQVVLVIQLALAVALAPPAAAEGPPQPIPGWYNYQTRVFTPAVQPPPAGEAKHITVKGTLIINATVALDAIPADQKVLAFFSAFLFDASNNNSVGGRLKVRRSGNTGTISVSIPYIFTVRNASETVTVEVDFATQQPPSFPYAQFKKTIPLPADGATTVVTLPAALWCK